MSLLILAAWLLGSNVATAQATNCGCYNVTVTLDANCQFNLTRNLVSDGPCAGAYVRVMDNTPGNGSVIDCAGVWTYGLFDGRDTETTTDDVVICWGKVTAEDKTAPALICPPADITLDCYDVNYVLNERRTIGNVGDDLRSPRPAANATDGRTINNAEGVAGTGDNCQLGLNPPGLVDDNYKNLGYAYYKDNCYNCGCRVTLKWTDKVVFYSCTDIEFTRDGYYAKIEREWVATDCNGMRADAYIQDIFFTRPDLDDFVFSIGAPANRPVTGKTGVAAGTPGYDWVVEYQSCTPDKSLILHDDVTPYDLSYFHIGGGVNTRRIYIDKLECNYSVSIKDTEFPICGGKGVKIDRELYVFDWCAGKIVDTFHILIKIGDFEAPKATYAHHAPYVISTGPMDCTAAFPVNVVGIKSAFGVEIKDNCTLANVSVSVYTKDLYVKGILVNEGPESPWCTNPPTTVPATTAKEQCCIAWAKIDYAIMNNQMIGVPVGRHVMKIEAFDGCYNSSTLCFEFEVKDKIAPVMKCDDDLHISLSNANGYVDGYAQVTAADIDEGSWDNCKLAWIAVRRNVPTSCTASFILKGYDSNGNNKIDAAPFDDPKDAPANWKWIVDGKEVVDGIDNNGDGDIFDRGEFFATKGGKIMTPLQDAVDFFCCDLAERVTIELWGADTADNPYTQNIDESNWNYCWNDVLIEDKVAPTCVAPWDITVDCDEKNLAIIEDKVASAAVFGDVSITTGSDCANLDTVYTVTKNLKCGYGKIVRSWALTKNTVKGPITITCYQTIWVRPIHQYDICFPKDVDSDCKTPIIDTVLTDELSCDILAVNITDKRYDASDDECYKIFRTYTVINWCAYDDRCGDPMAEGSVYVVDRGLWGNYGKNPIYMLVRDRDRDLNEEFWLSKDLTPNNGDDIYVRGDGNYGGYSSLGSSVTISEGLMPFCKPEIYAHPYDYFQDWEYYHSFMYTQIIKVYDEVAPVVTAPRDTFCIREGADCLADVTITVAATDNCTDKVTLETQYLMVAPGQTTNAGSMILYATPRWSTKDLGNGQFEITVKNLPVGTHDLIVVVRDECGNLSKATRIPFVVADCKGPAPICINGLSTELMPNGTGGGMMAVWASDFVASDIYDCYGQGEAKNGPETGDQVLDQPRW
ncbi:hypothetical protein [Haliscomenobacter hydrossis]|nr:hypothetical protein [Haliscomenobacter hydrossis]